MKIGGQLKEEFPSNEMQSFPYLLDMEATVKVARTQTEHLWTNFQLDQGTRATPLRNLTTFRDHSSKTEGAID